MLSLPVVFLLLWTLNGALPQEVIQPECFRRVKLGDTVVLRCLTNSMWSNRVWYKQNSNKTLQLLASTNYVFEKSVLEKGYVVETSATGTNLTIMHMAMGDIGTYYCGIYKSREVLFGPGTVLEMEGESDPVQSVLQSPDFIRAQPGDSVTLSCSFTSSQSEQEHTKLTWIKTGSSSEILSWNVGNDQILCENSSCVHNLTLEDIGAAEDGTYLCVVTICGDTLIGNTTRIHVYSTSDISPTVIALTVVSIAFCSVVVALVWLVCHYNRKMAKGDCFSNGQEIMDPDEVTYAGVSVVSRTTTHRSSSATPRNDTVVYSEVRNQHV